MWEDQPDQWVAAGFSAVWYLGYHTLFWLDLYLTGAEEGFAPPAPFELVEMRSGEVLPRTYTREELLDYLDYCRRKCQETIGVLSIEQACRLCRFPWGELPFAEANAVYHASCAGARRAIAHVPETTWASTRLTTSCGCHDPASVTPD